MKINDADDILLLCLYVDDLIFTSNNSRMIEDLKKSMTQEFEMTNLGLMSYFFGIEVFQGTNGIFIYQKRYAMELLKRFHMQDCNPVKTPIEVGTKFSKEGDETCVDPTYFK